MIKQLLYYYLFHGTVAHLYNVHTLTRYLYPLAFK